MIRVGRIDGTNIPKYPGFERIIVMTASSAYGELGPYVLKNKRGQIFENIWQAHKAYKRVPKVTQYYSRWDRTVVWDYPEETHLDSELNPNDKYWAWRKKLINNPYPVRYPVGFSPKARASCKYSLRRGQRLDYITSRKEIYLKIYRKLVRRESKYKKLLKKLETGKKLLILEVDGPHEESLPYYKEKYDVPEDWIEDDTILATPENLKIMLNDPKHPFGHGYCLAVALLEDSGIFPDIQNHLE